VAFTKPTKIKGKANMKQVNPALRLTAERYRQVLKNSLTKILFPNKETIIFA
jgi:hypothetical protein